MFPSRGEEPAREANEVSGEGGIRTYIPPEGTGGDIYHHRAERVGFEPTVGTSPTTVFETVPFNHSGTSPVCAHYYTKPS